MWAFMQPFTLIPLAPRRLIAPVAQALSEEIVAAIRASTEPTRACAKRYRVAQSTVVRIRCGMMRAHPTTKPPWIRLSDDAVEEMRVRHEESGWTLSQCAAFYGVPKSTAHEILKYRRR